MERDVEKEFLRDYQVKGGKWFEANLAGISGLKREVHKNANEFLFLRKGEDFGAFIEMLLELMSQSQDVINKVFSMYLERFPELNPRVILEKLIELDWGEILVFYKILTKSKELIIHTAELLRIILEPGRNKRCLPNLAILCKPDEVNKKARFGWEEMGFDVRHYKNSDQSGTHRYYLSENEYCFFIRKPDSTFFGFRGSDKALISELKKQFIFEWDQNE